MEQQEHWRQADAVRDGRQPSVDPDGDALAELGDGFRLYSFVTVGVRHVRKRLIDGVWTTVGVVESAEPHPAVGSQWGAS